MSDLPNWLAILVFATPLVTLAGSAVAFVVKEYSVRSELRTQRLFKMFKEIDSDLPLVTKVAAIYSLREFSEHSELIGRVGRAYVENLHGPNSAIGPLRSEMLRTLNFMGESKAENLYD